jgi:hypothetical protein
MGCFWSHDWSNWTDPKEVPVMRMYKGEQVGSGIDHMQRRTCSKCSLVEERTI